MTQLQSFMPLIYLGTYGFVYGPNAIQADLGGTYVAIHPVLNGKEQTEPVGFGADKIMMNGFVYSTNSQALSDMENFSAGSSWKNRPVCVGFFSQDNSSASSSQLWYSNVGYLQDPIHFEYRGGYGVYKYPFRFSFIEAQPQVLISCTDSGDHTSFTFSMTGQPNGFLAGFQLTGSAISSGGVSQYPKTIKNNAASTIGQGFKITGGGNELFVTNPQSLNTTGGSPLYWPIVDNSSLQSIALVAPTGTYTVTWNVAFTSVPTMKAIYIVV